MDDFIHLTQVTEIAAVKTAGYLIEYIKRDAVQVCVSAEQHDNIKT
jgi:hypothetical protein